MMDLADKYLSFFNDIESYLKDYLNLHENHKSFYEMIKLAKYKNYIIKNHEHILKDLANIRNTIVHTQGREYLAVPNEHALKILEEIRSKLLKPKKIFQIIKNNIEIMDNNDSLKSILYKMNINNFSQIPIYHESTFKGLITSNSISRWLSNNIEDDDSVIQELNKVKPDDILKYNEEQDEPSFISRNTDLIDFVNKYIYPKEKAYYFIITEHGKKTEKPLSFISPYDFDKIFNEL